MLNMVTKFIFANQYCAKASKIYFYFFR